MIWEGMIGKWALVESGDQITGIEQNQQNRKCRNRPEEHQQLMEVGASRMNECPFVRFFLGRPWAVCGEPRYGTIL